ncbi:MAG: DUF4032 domain-containing protein [Candidatus Eremiobacterota bacterium]
MVTSVNYNNVTFFINLDIPLIIDYSYVMQIDKKLNIKETDIFIRQGHPDFLDLPWTLPLVEWEKHCSRLEKLPCGLSRHTVVFVNYNGVLYALKELPAELAEKEYNLLRQMEEIKLPVVSPVGHVKTVTADGNMSVLITKYLEYSLPYYSIFMHSSLERYRQYLLDAITGLLVQLHLSGVYWGDCSLSNALFRRDAGALQAYLVDAETSEIHPTISDNLRKHELEIMEENISGALADLAAITKLPPDYPIYETGEYIHKRYEELWNVINKEQVIRPDEKYRIQEHVRTLNAMGFSVDELEIKTTETGERLKLRAFVSDRSFHSDLLHSLTGIVAEEMQARLIINEIQGLKVNLSKQNNRSTPLSVAAFHWLNELFTPVLEKLKDLKKDCTQAELYCQILEHKWFLSEQEKRDVGHDLSVEDYIKKFGQNT